MVFEDLWQNSIGIETKIAEIETGKPTEKTQVIRDPTVAKKMYVDVMDSAKEEILTLTSAEGLLDVWNNITKLKEKTVETLVIKVMAPITKDNIKTAIELSECCQVRHVPLTYSGVTIIDGKHLFQFKNTKGKLDTSLAFDSTIYTNDSEYVEKTRCMLNGFWDKAYVPSLLTVEEITKPAMPQIVPVPDEEYTVSRKDSPQQTNLIKFEEEIGITEEYVLNKLINAKRTPVKDLLKDIVRNYGSSATAVIHPPSSFNLPDMLLTFYHVNKQSAAGAEDWFQVYLWLDTPQGKVYVPVAIIGDNPEGLEQHKLTFGNTPASQNCHLLKKDELQIQVHGNTLFAGWTVPIPLYPPQYTLPPASVLIEGYGKLKSSVVRMAPPSGVKVVTEGSGFDAFVTFFHPASKYVGPGTDGIFVRDFVNTVYPPSAPK